MQCVICKDVKVSPLIPPYGGFVCASREHVLCFECALEAGNCCFVCGKPINAFTMKLSQNPKSQPSASNASPPPTPPIGTEPENVTSVLEEAVKNLSSFEFPAYIIDDIKNQPNISDEELPFYESPESSDSFSETSSIKSMRMELQELNVHTNVDSVVTSSSLLIDPMELGMQDSEENITFEVNEKEDNNLKEANELENKIKDSQLSRDTSKDSETQRVLTSSLLKLENKEEICKAFKLNPDVFWCNCGGIILHVRPRNAKCYISDALEYTTKRQPMCASIQTEKILIDSLVALVEDNRSTLMANRRQLATGNRHQLNVLDTGADAYMFGRRLTGEKTLEETINDVKYHNELLKLGQQISQSAESHCLIQYQRSLFQNRCTQIPLCNDYPDELVNSEQKHAERLLEDLGTYEPYEPYISQSPLYSDCKTNYQQDEESKPKSNTQPVGVESSVDFLNYFLSNRNKYMERMHGRNEPAVAEVDQYINQTCDSDQTLKSDNNTGYQALTMNAPKDEFLDLVHNSATELPVSDQHELTIVNEPHTENRPKSDYNSIDSFDSGAAGYHVDPSSLPVEKQSVPCPVCLHKVALKDLSLHLRTAHENLSLNPIIPYYAKGLHLDSALFMNPEPTTHSAYFMFYFGTDTEDRHYEVFLPFFLMSACITVPPNSESAIEERNQESEYNERNVSESSSESQFESSPGNDSSGKQMINNSCDVKHVMVWLIGKELSTFPAGIPVEFALKTLSGTDILTYSGKTYSIHASQEPASVYASDHKVLISAKYLDQLTNNCKEMIEAVVTADWV